MSVQYRPADAPSLAQMTLEIPFTRMYFRMRVQVDFQWEPFLAIHTHVLPLTFIGVHTHVVFVKIGGRVESLWTPITFVLSFIEVRLFVMVQIAGSDEAFTAKRTNMRPISSMVQLVG